MVAGTTCSVPQVRSTASVAQRRLETARPPDRALSASHFTNRGGSCLRTHRYQIFISEVVRRPNSVRNRSLRWVSYLETPWAGGDKRGEGEGTPHTSTVGWR